jgi:endonuclease/exonuclease/phosphatase family metal-dependent hydrolase
MTPTAPGDLRILSWNLHGLAWPLSQDPVGRMDRVAAKIRDLAPDVVMLQEVWLRSHLDRLVAALQPDWTPIFVDHRGRASGGLLTLVNSSAGWRAHSAPEFHPFTASAPVWKIWEGDGLAGKGVLCVAIEFDERRICAVNTHLQAQYSGITYTEIREAQLIQLGKVVSQFHPAIPAIVAGDFNTDAREPLYSLVAAIGVDLTFKARGQGNVGTTANPREGRPEWIDYIVAANSQPWDVSANLELIANERADFPYSDHSGLLCTLTLTPRERAS